MVQIYSMISDIHGDTSYIKAHNTVMNHLKDKFSIKEINSILAGDLVEEEHILGISKQEQYSNLKKEFKEFKGDFYAVRGNHDDNELLEEIIYNDSTSKVKNIEFQNVKINGKNHYGVRHYSMDINKLKKPENSINNYDEIDEHINELNESEKNIDVIVTHEGIDDFSYNGNQNEFLKEYIVKNNKSMICGHVHSNKFKINEKNSTWIRTNGTSDNKSLYFRVNEGKKERIYELANSDLRKWASEIDPEGTYTKSNPSKQMNSKEYLSPHIEKYPELYNDFIIKNHPEFVEKLISSQQVTPQIIDEQNRIMKEFDNYIINHNKDNTSKNDNKENTPEDEN